MVVVALSPSHARTSSVRLPTGACIFPLTILADPVPTLRDLRRELAKLLPDDPWRAVLAVRIRLLEAAEAERLRSSHRA